ncbi:hypothetical protein ADK57_06870 [Streptomyces sp. MMG1533]|uniref:hypothetical protein n=1 Tax=Streptomyces sp. MMG1533 TaxID=1415546 RepID=UPI0006AD990F|nr:hypothetical protein [Streptomyces sp. MMG1533]KOU74838.1 hypothetical protein ADK57_06870 [Streptomyces sp. MMG1533]
MTNTMKRYVTACAAVVTAIAGMVATAPAASANPSSGVNIRGKEPFNTDVLMSKLCGDMTGADKSFVFNIHTGQVVDSDKAYGKAPYYHLAAGPARSVHSDLPYGEHWALTNGWEVVVGNCEFPASSSWTWLGKERRISNDSVTNCGHGTASLGVNESYATTRGASVSVGLNAKFGYKSGDLAAEVGASVSYSWSWSKTHTLGRQVTISVPRGYQGWIDARPHMRTVRINPVFHVQYYNWSDGQSEVGTVVHSWRGRGYDRIWSFGYYVDAYADIVNSDGTPAMDYVARDKPGSC